MAVGDVYKRQVKYILRPFAPLFANAYFACGEYAAYWMYGKKKVKSGKVRILLNAIDIQHFLFDEKARIQMRSKLGLDNMEIKINSLDSIHEAAKQFIAAMGDNTVFAFYGKMGEFLAAISLCSSSSLMSLLNFVSMARRLSV